MNRRSLFGKLIGAVVGIKVAPEVAKVHLDPAFKVGGDVSKLDLLFINEASRIEKAVLSAPRRSWWVELADAERGSSSTLNDTVYERIPS